MRTILLAFLLQVPAWVVEAPTGHSSPSGLPEATTLGSGVRPAIMAADTLGEGEGRRTCTAREAARHRLIVEGGNELYVDPTVLVPSGGRTLLAGQPTYLFSKQDRAGPVSLTGTSTVFGAVLAADGSARSVPIPPIKSKIAAAITAVARAGGSWRVIFAELDSLPFRADKKVLAYWHGVYDGRRWSSVEQLPSLPEVSLGYFNHSSVAERGDTVVWAALVHPTPTTQAVAVFERRRSKWSYHILPTPFASYAALAHSPQLGFVLAVAHLDTTLKNGGNSLFLYQRRQAWRPLRKVVARSGGSVHHPALNLAGQTGILTWKTFMRGDVPARFPIGFGEPAGGAAGVAGPRTELQAMIGPMGPRDEPVVVIDPTIAEGWKSVTLPNGSPLWVVDHVVGGSVRELQIVRRSKDSTAALWQTPYPYRGGFTAVALPGPEVLIAGPLLEQTREVLVSLLLRVRVQCDSTEASMR